MKSSDRLFLVVAFLVLAWMNYAHWCASGRRFVNLGDRLDSVHENQKIIIDNQALLGKVCR